MGFLDDLATPINNLGKAVFGKPGDGMVKLPTYPKTAAESELEKLLAASALSSLTAGGAASSELAGIAAGKLPPTWQAALSTQLNRQVSAVDAAARQGLTDTLARLSDRGVVNSSLAQLATGNAARQAAAGVNDAMGAASTSYLSMLDSAAKLAMLPNTYADDRTDAAWAKAFELFDALARTRTGSNPPVTFRDGTPGLITSGADSFFSALGKSLGD